MLGKDLGYAARALRKSPVFLITATLTIALGIGASTAIFSVANAVLLRPLPYRDPDRLVLAGGDMRVRNVFDQPMSNENFTDLRDRTKSMFEDFGAVVTFRNNVPRADGTPEQVHFAQVTTNFFRLLGARIAVGRDFDDSEGLPQPAPPAGAAAGTAPPPRLPTIAILSYEYWQRRFGGNRAILGHAMQNNAPNSPQIVGVLAPGFELLFPPDANIERTPDVWTAARPRYDNAQRNTFFLRGIGRLKPNATLDKARDEAELAAAEIRRNFQIYGTGGFHFHLDPMHQHLVAEVRPTILALMGAVTFLLLIACANVANLLLVRASLRERELAVRAALGGSRWRLIRQMLAEALMLASGGTLLGLLLAKLGIYELMAISPANLPRLDKIAIDPIVLTFSILAGLAAAAIFGLAPALRASRPDVMDVLRGSGRTAGLGGGGSRNIVAVAEVALSFVLLVGSGLMVRSFIALQHIDPGFDPQNLLTFQLLGGRGGPQPQQRAARVREIQTRLSALGGVKSVTASTPFPLTGGFSPIRWGLESALADPSKYQAVDWQTVLPGYFEALHTPLIAGRVFTDADNAPDRNFAIVDQFLAAKAFPKESAVGKRILIRIRTPEAEWVEIVGVVAHQRQMSLAEPGREQIYFTDGFVNYGRVGTWAIRTTGDPAQLSRQVRAEIRKLDPSLLINELQPMSAWMDRAQAGTRFSLLLIGVFAVIAALLASVGLYGVLSTFVRQRTAEIGVRMALGAAPGTIFSLVVGQGLRLSAAGILVGVAAALGLTRVMSSMLVGVKPTDPVTFALMVVFFFAIAVVACGLPAWRASGLDPTVALRAE
jgi:putative ABC transport system permease protein